MPHDSMYYVEKLFKAGAIHNPARSNDWTVYQQIAFNAGASVELVTSHEWHWWHIEALYHGATPEQALKYDGWSDINQMALDSGLTIDQALSHDWDEELISCWSEFRSENFEQECLGKQAEESADL